MYNYKNIHKKAYTNADIINRDAATMSNAFGGSPSTANRQTPIIINNNVPTPQQNTGMGSILPWLLIGGVSIAGLGAWHKYGHKVKGWLNTYNEYKKLAPSITSSAKNLSDSLGGLRDQYNTDLAGKPRLIPQKIWDAWWAFKNRDKIKTATNTAADSAKSLATANSAIDAAGTEQTANRTRDIINANNHQ